jgi:hypothetical protein
MAGSSGGERKECHGRAVGGQELQVRPGAVEGDVHLRLAVAGQLRRGRGRGLAPDGHTETVEIDLKKIRDGVYLNSWTEASGATVTHVEDFANATLYSNVTVDGTLHNLVGTITEA